MGGLQGCPHNNMKQIDTLVEDIYELFNSHNTSLSEKEVDTCINTFAESIKSHV